MKVEELKKIIKPQELAQRLLGSPEHIKNGVLWYKSPLRREERTASFEVTESSFHDFGTNEHFDIIEFVKRLNHCSFKEAVDYLASLYGIADNPYENKRMLQYLEQQRIANKMYRQKVEKWYWNFFDYIEKEWDNNELCIRATAPKTKDKCMFSYKYFLDREIYLGQLREEILATNTFEEKARLMSRITKEGLPQWLTKN